MSKKIPIEECIGKRYGRWLTIEEGLKDKRGLRTMKCVCDCGTIRDVPLSRLRFGSSQSCGCINIEIHTERLTSHNMCYTPEYKTWESMKRRCTMPSQDRFKNYGGRGITVCDRWFNSFENFFEDMGIKPDRYSIERIDNDGNYEPSNCKWIPLNEQQSNTTQNHLLTFQGITKTLSKWAKDVGLKQPTLRRRLKNGWSIERALTESLTPSRWS